MEVETQTLPSFDLQLIPSFPFALHVDVDVDVDVDVESHEGASSDLNCDLESTAIDAHNYPTNEHSVVLIPEDKSMQAISESLVALNLNLKPTETVAEKCERTESSVALSVNVKSTEINNQESASFESTAAVKLQKVYRSYRTRRRLADSAVVAEELWWQAIDFARLNHSTISFFDYLKPETTASRWNRIRLNASKVGKGLSKDAKAKKLAFQHWIEAIDPRHRYGHDLHFYYDAWCKGDAGQPFFYWLDIGDGREVDLQDCSRAKLRQHCIKYLGPQEREHFEYIIVEGKIVHKQTGELMDTTTGSQGAKWIFVTSTTKKLYAGEKKKGKFHHSSFLAGGATLAAGRLVAVDGVLKSISAYSGHYRPTDENLGSLLDFLKENEVNVDEVEIRSSTEDYDYNKDNKSIPTGSANGAPYVPKPPQLEEIPKHLKRDQPSEPTTIAQSESRGSFQRTLSGGLQSPRADVPKKAILQRMNSKKVASSYQLGNQLSLKWSTGAGPRIGCIADYPLELRLQALEFVNLSPRVPPTPSASGRIAGLISPTSPLTSDPFTVGVTSVV